MAHEHPTGAGEHAAGDLQALGSRPLPEYGGHFVADDFDPQVAGTHRLDLCQHTASGSPEDTVPAAAHTSRGKPQITTSGHVESRAHGAPVCRQRVSVVGVATRPTFRLVSTEATLPRPFGNAGGEQVRLYDMAPDGHIYGFLSSASANAASDRFRVVLNWVDELKRRVPTR